MKIMTRSCFTVFLLAAVVSFAAGEYGYDGDVGDSSYGDGDADGYEGDYNDGYEGDGYEDDGYEGDGDEGDGYEGDGYGEDTLASAIEAADALNGLFYGESGGMGEGGEGDDLFGDEGGEEAFDAFLLDEELFETGMLMMTTCGISLENLMETGATLSSSDPSGIMDAISSFLDVVGDKCPADKESDFNNAMDYFETCAGMDLMQVIQTLPSAILGMDMVCLQSILKQVSAGDDSTEITDFGDDCAESAFGTNPLGNMVRSLYLRPDTIIPCFKTLSESLPDCTLPMWPMPVVGIWLKDFSCMIGAASPYLDDMCQAELEVLDMCLGESDNSDCDTDTVECAEQGSTMFTLPDPLIGIPVSDACRRVADAQGLSTVVDRYEQTTKQCIQAWPGWGESFTISSASKNYMAPGEGASTVSAPASGESTANAAVSQQQDVDPPTAPTVSSPVSGESTANEISKQNYADASARESGEMVDTGSVSDSGTSAFSLFMYGVGSGLALVGVAWALLSMRRKGQGRRGGFASVEMVEGFTQGDLV